MSNIRHQAILRFSPRVSVGSSELSTAVDIDWLDNFINERTKPSDDMSYNAMVNWDRPYSKGYRAALTELKVVIDYYFNEVKEQGK